MALVIGLTGSIATGKSTVSNMFKQLSIPVVDADVIARNVVEPHTETHSKIVNVFGKDILHDDRTLNRKKLGKLVFSNEEKRKQLNAIIHPAIRKEMLLQRDNLIASGKKCVVLDIPLLFENKLMHFVDKVIVVYVDEEIQLKRLMDRDNYSVEEAKKRIQAQMPVSKKAKMADAIVDNSRTKEDSYNQLVTILKKWQVL